MLDENEQARYQEKLAIILGMVSEKIMMSPDDDVDMEAVIREVITELYPENPDD